MRAKVQFINGDLTGATETYRAIETRYSDNFEAKEMLKRISKSPAGKLFGLYQDKAGNA